jgi:rSAM/selenodomain-associated transferase 1
MKKSHIIIFAKAPLPGLAKTRLIPALGAEGAARLARVMLQHTLREALAVGADCVELCTTPGPKDQAWMDCELPVSMMRSDQGEGILGERLARASERALVGSDAVLLIGTDCPGLNSRLLHEALTALQHSEAVMIPAMDGGYVLLGIKRFEPSLFEGIAWSTSTVAEATRERISQLSWRLHCLPAVCDVDEPADLKHLPEGWI